jgi:enoyl-CoA hydratase/carnithine racemase
MQMKEQVYNVTLEYPEDGDNKINLAMYQAIRDAVRKIGEQYDVTTYVAIK